jgi:hypothetical protein
MSLLVLTGAKWCFSGAIAPAEGVWCYGATPRRGAHRIAPPTGWLKTRALVLSA